MQGYRYIAVGIS
jgi:hypothetical protein